MKLNLKALPAIFLLALSGGTPLLAAAQVPPSAHHAPSASFASPQDAASGLAAAMRSHDRRRMHAILGHEADRYIQSADTQGDIEALTRFLAAYDESSRIDMKSDSFAVLHVGSDDWPLPFPLVKRGGRWHFDGKAGEQEWQDRRVGKNELAAIQVELAYVDAQRDYVLKDHDRDGLLEYAQRIVSHPGQHDGLYWAMEEGGKLSPMGQAFASANKPVRTAGALDSAPFHGYYFRILTAQGSAAPGGELDYMVNGKLIGGFALLGYPAAYRNTGIKTFIVDHDGVVFSKDLGPQTAAAADAITRFDPDSSWQKESP